MRIATNAVGAALLIVAGSAAISHGREVTVPSPPSEPLKAYLRSYLSLGGKVSPDVTTRITAVGMTTKDGATDEVVYLSGRQWCGSGGCTLLILEAAKSTFKVLGRVTIVQLPIRLLPSTKDGHPDIGVTVRGGGVKVGYEAVLSFKEKSYPGNPSLPPARRSTSILGKVLIANTDASVPLYD